MLSRIRSTPKAEITTTITLSFKAETMLLKTFSSTCYSCSAGAVYLKFAVVKSTTVATGTILLSKLVHIPHYKFYEKAKLRTVIGDTGFFSSTHSFLRIWYSESIYSNIRIKVVQSIQILKGNSLSKTALLHLDKVWI